MQVAYRTGEPCYVCGTPIQTKRVGGRNAFFVQYASIDLHLFPRNISTGGIHGKLSDSDRLWRNRVRNK
ncbi:zinc finger domain-containing protein [Thermosinus carboxydivorans]|uniref:zinc finger domain-containing protein n=1 Tax=Thermosinus carboxydivorans TaxID=261685 RepID=UPI0012EAC7AC